RIGNPLARCGLTEARKLRKLMPAAVPHGDREIPLEVTEEEEWHAGAPFLAREQQGNVRREQQQKSHGPQRLARDERDKPLAVGTVAHLIVVLQEIDESHSRKIPTGLAT